MEDEYIQFLSASKFVMCPRGIGPSSYRIFEAMAVGRVPVIISDDWVEPAGVDWSTCSIRIPEAAISQIPALLEQVEPRWHELAANAARAYAELFSTKSLFQWIGDQLEALRACRRLANVDPFAQVASTLSEIVREGRSFVGACVRLAKPRRV